MSKEMIGEKTPQHIGIILDGNRRWAKERGLPGIIGHTKGYQKVRKLFRWIRELGVQELTLYCFSVQNFKRSAEEVKALMDIFEKGLLDAATDPHVHKHKVSLNVIGRTYLLPENVQKAVNVAIAATENYHNYRVNFAIGYGGREEIVDAVKSVVKKIVDKTLMIEDIDEDTLTQNLYLQSDPDLIIRTGGDYRTSNFLAWQSNYSEWFFLPKCWPAFEKADLAGVIDEFRERERRYGG